MDSGRCAARNDTRWTFPVPMSAGYIPFHPNPSKPKYKPPAGRGRRALPRVRAGGEFPVRAEAQIHALRRAEGEAVRAARFPRLRQERDRAGDLPRQRQPRDGRCARNSNGKAKGVAFVGEEITDAELKELDDAGVRGVRFNFVKRLVDSRRATCCSASPARIATLGWHIVIYFEHADLDEMGPFLNSLPTTLVFDHMGCPNVKEGVERQALPELAQGARRQQELDHKVTCPERLTRRRPAL